MFLDLVLMLSWIVAGVVGTVWLNRKGYLTTKTDPRTTIQSSRDRMGGLEVASYALVGRFILPVLGGPITLLVALLLPGKVRHTV